MSGSANRPVWNIKKPACPSGDVDDVTLGSPAVFHSIALMTDSVSSAKPKDPWLSAPFSQRVWP
jgi:hypothetical protein